jgi:uncharacterized membrane protein YphA (DoxX/SURF4 family)
MKTAFLPTSGRIAFALAIIGFGTLCLGYADFVSALQPVPASIPGYRLLAILNGAILLAMGIMILLRAGTGLAAGVLILFFASWIAFLHIPSAFLQPTLLRSPWWIRTFETVALAGGALVLAGRAATPLGTRWVRYGRVAFGAGLPVFGVLHLVYPANVASLVPPWYPWPTFWAYFTGFAQIAAGIAIAAGVLPRIAAMLAGVMYGSWALTLHIPRSWCRAFGSCEFLPEAVGLQGSRPGLTSLFVAIGMCGAAWIVAGGGVLDLPGTGADQTERPLQLDSPLQPGVRP